MHESHFARVGGAGAVKTVVERLYELILADPDVAPLFDGVAMPRLRRHMAAMLTLVLGGPTVYEGRTLDVAHADLRITEHQYGRVGQHLLRVLREQHVEQDILDHVVEVLGSVRGDIVTAFVSEDSTVSAG